jgi:hypothetical protein
MNHASRMTALVLSVAACGRAGVEARDGGMPRDGSLRERADVSMDHASETGETGAADSSSSADSSDSSVTPCLGTWTGQRCVLLLASGQNSPAALAVDSTSVYWLNGGTYADGNLMKVAKNGGPLVTLATAQPFPGAISLDATSVYWTINTGESGALLKMPKEGGTPTTLVSGLNQAGGVVVSSGDVYFTAPALMKVAVDGWAATTLSSTDDADGLAVNGSGVYWTTSYDGTVLEMGVNGGAPTTLASGQHAFSIVLDSAHLYWLTGTNDAGTVMSAPLSGAPAITLATGPLGTFGLSVGTTALYWQTYGGTGNNTLMKVPLDGGATTALASGLDPPSPLTWVYGAGTTAVDDTSVYAIGGETILKVTPR